MLDVTGYTDRWVYRAGETVELRVSATMPRVCWQLIRHLGAISKPEDWTGQTALVANCRGHFDSVQNSTIVAGSYFSASIAVHSATAGYRLEFALNPTLLPTKDSLLARMQFGEEAVDLVADQNGEMALLGRSWERQRLEGVRLAVNSWMHLSWTLCLCGDGLSVTVDCGPGRASLEFSNSVAFEPLSSLFLAGDGAKGLFDGKIESPTLEGLSLNHNGSLSSHRLAAWDFSDFSLGQFSVPERVAGGSAGVLHNAPTRGVTSSRYTGRSCNFVEALHHYAAAWFHRDDILDAGWCSGGAIELPDLESGVYSIVISGSEEIDWQRRVSFDAIPLFVRPSRNSENAVALVLPTFSYRAYANNTFAEEADPAIFRRKKQGTSKPLYDHAIALNLLSLYSLHGDGSGVALASLKRPQLTIRADFDSQLQGFPHQFSADLAIIEWLEALNISYDILTDEVLHEEGVAAISSYKLLLTGSHPEYSSAALLDAYHDFNARGGSILYLGGNGFYWSVGLDPRFPELLEVRRSEGTRTWTAGVGERRQQLDGQDGGIWRSLGRPPNALFGIGFCAHGFSGDGNYVAVPSNVPPQFARIRSFLEAQGDRPFGIAGLEIDRYAPEFGSGNDVIVLASLHSMPAGYLPTVEEFGGLDVLIKDAYATLAERVRGNIVMRLTEGGGCIFSVGSIRWTSGLIDDSDQHGVCALTSAALLDLLDYQLSTNGVST